MNEAKWRVKFDNQAEKYHRIGAWVAISLNLAWAAGDYFEVPEYWQQFFAIRLSVSLITLIAFFIYKKINLSPAWLIFVPFLGIALQNAYMYSVMDALQLQKHTFAYIALFIGAGMLILWKPIYSYLVVGLNIIANLIFFPLFSPLKVDEVFVNGGMLTFTVTVFTILLIHTRYTLTKKEIIARIGLEESKKEIEIQKANVDLAFEQLEEKNTEILDSINYAKRIQSAILPPSKQVKKYLPSSFIHYKPKDIVAGDFYWLEPVAGFDSAQPATILFAAADCTGHGVPGAMVSVVCNNGLNRSVREYGLTDPAKILDKTREIVIREFDKSEDVVKDGMDIALCSLRFRSANKEATLEYAGAHNPLWIVRKDSSEVEEIKANKQPIGEFFKQTLFTTHKIELKEGDSFYIFSDGYPDQFGGEKGKKFKTANFKKLLISIQSESMEDQEKILSKAFEDWKGDLEQVDDVCVIGVRV